MRRARGCGCCCIASYNLAERRAGLSYLDFLQDRPKLVHSASLYSKTTTLRHFSSGLNFTNRSTSRKSLSCTLVVGTSPSASFTRQYSWWKFWKGEEEPHAKKEPEGEELAGEHPEAEEAEQWTGYAYISEEELEYRRCTEPDGKDEKLLPQKKRTPPKKRFDPWEQYELTKALAFSFKADGLNNLGVMHAKGEVTEKDLRRAKELLHQAVELELPRAYYNLGGIYEEEGNMEKAVEMYKKGAQLGEVRAMVALGVCYLDGIGTSANGAEAVSWFSKAADEGFLPGRFELGLCYLKEDGVKRDTKKGLALLEDCATKGYIDAAKLLSKMYSEGEEEDGIARDPSKGLQFLRIAARKDPQAMVRLGAKYLEGKDGLRVDEQKAFKYFLSAAALGDPQGEAWTGCCYLHGNGVSKDLAEGKRYLSMAAEKGDPVALYELGALAWFGEDDTVMADPQRAFELFTKAAEKGHPHAKFALGRIYETGDAVAVDSFKAVSLYEEAAKDGSSDAEAFLGMMYEDGRVPGGPDSARAVALYISAARKGNPIAQAALGMAYAEGKGGLPVDRRKAFELFEKAAQQGNGEALSHLAFMYEMGEVSAGSVEPDYRKAALYYQQAVDQGIPSASIGLAGLYFRGLGVDRDVEKAKELYHAAAAKGLADGHFYLGELYAELALSSRHSSDESEQQKNEAKAYHHFSLAADGGYAEAQFELGMLYAEGGLGVETNLVQARRYLLAASAQGHQGAADYLNSLPSFTPPEKNSQV